MFSLFVVLFQFIKLRSIYCMDLTIHLMLFDVFVAVEGLKTVEIEKCKKDITDIKDQIWTAQKKFVDYNRMR